MHPFFFAPEFEKESLSGVRREEDFDIFFEVHQPSPWRSQTTGPTDSTDISKYQQLSTDINSYQQTSTDSTDINSYQQIIETMDVLVDKPPIVQGLSHPSPSSALQAPKCGVFHCRLGRNRCFNFCSEGDGWCWSSRKATKI